MRAALAEFRAALQEGRDTPDQEAAARYPDLMPELLERLAEVRLVHSALEVPKAIDRYTPRSWLGTGGFGVVYEADIAGGGKCALKLLRSEHVADRKALLRFEREAKTAAALQHEHIVKVLEVGKSGSRLYIAMQLIDGPNLEQLVEDEPPDPNEAVRLLLPVVHACHYAHSCGVIHRDIKPANILIDSKTRKPYLTDFGLAKYRDASIQLTTPHRMIGTPGYMAPEQILPENRPRHATDEAAAGCRTDVYSLGATLYFMLTGRPPFPVVHPSEFEVEIRDSVAHHAVLRQTLWLTPIHPCRLNKAVPAPLQEVCLKCLEYEPDERFASAGELATQLERFLAGQRVHAPRPGPHKRLWSLCRRRPRAATTVAALLALSAAAGVIAYAENSRATQSDIELGKTKTEVSKAKTEVSNVKQTADAANQRAAKTEQDNRAKQYDADLQQVGVAWDQNDLERVRSLLDRQIPVSPENDLRNIEWYYWDHRLRYQARSIDTHQSCRSVALGPNGSSVAIVDDDRVSLWDVNSGAKLFDRAIGNRVDGVALQLHQTDQSVAISKDGRYLAATGFRYDAQSRHGSLTVWSIPDGHQVLSVRDQPQLSGRAVVFSPDNEYVVGGGFASWSAWELSTGKPATSPHDSASQLRPYANLIDSNTGRSGTTANGLVVWGLRFCDGALVSSCDSLPPVFWSWPNGVGNQPRPADLENAAGTEPVGWGATVIRINGGIPELMGVNGTERPALQLGNQRGVTALACHEGTVALAGDDNAVWLWNASSPHAPAVAGPFRGHRQEVNCISLSSDGQFVASAEIDGFILVHSRASDAPLPLRLEAPIAWNASQQVFNAPLAAHFDQQRSALVVQRTVPSAVAGMPMPGPDLVEFPLPKAPVDIGFYAGGRFVAASYRTGNVSRGTLSATVVLWDLDKKQEAATIAPVQAGAALAFSFTHDGEQCAIGLDSKTGDVAIYDHRTGKVTTVPGQPGNLSVQMSPGGRYLGLGGNWGCGVLSLPDMQWRLKSDLCADQIAFDPPETRVFVSATVPTHRSALYSLPMGTEIATPFGSGFSDGVTFSIDGRRAFIPTGKATVEIYDAESWTRLTTVPYGNGTSPVPPECFDSLLAAWKRERGKDAKSH